MLYVRLTIKVKVGDTSELQSRMLPPQKKKLGRVTLTDR